MSIPENHPFVNVHLDEQLADEVVAQRLSVTGRRRPTGPTKSPMRKTAADVDLVMSEQDIRDAEEEVEAQSAALNSRIRGSSVARSDRAGHAPEATSQGDILGLSGVGGCDDGMDPSEVESMQRRAALRARQHMTGAGE
jgi:hypothetical protein